MQLSGVAGLVAGALSMACGEAVLSWAVLDCDFLHFSSIMNHTPHKLHAVGLSQGLHGYYRHTSVQVHVRQRPRAQHSAALSMWGPGIVPSSTNATPIAHDAGSKSARVVTSLTSLTAIMEPVSLTTNS
jgi:hypothetical protein